MVTFVTPPAFDSWLSHGSGIQADTPHQLFAMISRIALLAPDRTYAWRGQQDASWDLSASLFREIRNDGGEVTEERVREREKYILDEAHTWGLGRDLGPSATSMHMLGILQHHGVPTRFIDVTANPMTALWFATEEHKPDTVGRVLETSGVLFAIDVTDTEWYETFQYGQNTWAGVSDPLGGFYRNVLKKSAEDNQMFRVFSALPDERMKAQEGFFLGSTVPERHDAPGILGLNPIGPPPGREELENLLSTDDGSDGRTQLPFCAIVIPPSVKNELRGPLKHTYNRRRRVLYPDVDGFREGLARNQLD